MNHFSHHRAQRREYKKIEYGNFQTPRELARQVMLLSLLVCRKFGRTIYFRRYMQAKDVEKIITYWQLTAKHDYDTMLSLFDGKRYSDCLFYGHIMLEKILKSLVVKEIKMPAPYLHDLVRLHELAKIQLSEKELDVLDAVNEFNIRSRYPEQKLSFYKQCTRSYTQKYLKEIVSLYHKLCQMLK